MSHPIKVMLVDDSAVIRGLVMKTLEDQQDIKVVASASNGQMALSLLTQEKPDVIVLDIEMPVMDGLTALPKLREIAPHTPIIMFSTLTLRNAEISLKALSLGATDYVAKPTSTREKNAAESFGHELISKIRALTAGHERTPASSPATATTSAVLTAKPDEHFTLRPGPTQRPKALAIGSSTGGPQALITLFSAFKTPLSVPIFITQHMPPMFTKIFAERLAVASGRKCVEALDNLPVENNTIYIAPGDYHMTVETKDKSLVIRLNQEPQENFCRPAVDPMLRSLVKVYGGHLFTVILTGMGQDGMEGAKLAVNAGGHVIAQDAATSTVWGMPGAVAKQNICSAVLPLAEIPLYLDRLFGGAALGKA